MLKRAINEVDGEKDHEAAWQETLSRRILPDSAASCAPQSIAGIFCSLLSRLTLINKASKMSRAFQDIKDVLILYMSFFKPARSLSDFRKPRRH